MSLFTLDNTTSAFQCRFHFCWPSHGRQPTFADSKVQEVVKQAFEELTTRQDYHILESAFEPHVFRALLSLKPSDAPAEVTRLVKGNLAAAVRKRLSRSQLWSRGWFVRSVGHVTNETVRNYITSQYEHHNATPVETPAQAARAKYHHAGEPAELRRGDHVVFEYNVHIVFVTWGRREFLDLDVAESLVEYWRRQCELNHWIAWDIEVVWNHAHLFLGLRPTDAPGKVAVSLMNESENFLQQRYGAAVAEAKGPTIWRPSYYVGTVGSATTAQVKAYLEERGDERAKVEGQRPPG